MKKRFLQIRMTVIAVMIGLLLGVVGMMNAFAQNFTMDDLNYSINGDGVSVTVTGHVNGTEATGTLTIPENVFYEGTDYSVSTIGNSAFYDCSRLTGNLTIPNSVTTIGNGAFSRCSGFSGSLTIPNSVVSIGCDAFTDCLGFFSIVSFAETPPILDDSYYYYSGYCVFCGWSSNTPIYVPCGSEEAYASSSWTMDGFNNFVGMCGGTVTLATIAEEYGTVAGGGAFDAGQNCTITATANDGYVFTHWTHNGRLISLDAEYTFYVAGDMTFEAHFVPISNIIFADANVKEICVANWDANGDGELSYSEAAAVTRLGQVFSNKSTLVSFDELQFFTGLSFINKSAFAGCSGLSSITVPNTVTGIASFAFSNCSSLSSITIPAFVDLVGTSAFAGCSLLSSVCFTGNVSQWCRINFIQGSNPLIQAHNLYINDCLVTDLVIPDEITEINIGSFCGATCLTSLTMHDSVTSIGNWAFLDCSGLSEVIMYGAIPPILGVSSFDGSTCPIYVPYESLNDYKTAANWCNYESRIFPITYTAIGDADDDHDAPFAYIHNGEIVITADVCNASLQVVDMTGRVVVSYSGHIRCVPTSGMPMGVYVLRLIDGEDVKTQKIVIR